MFYIIAGIIIGYFFFKSNLGIIDSIYDKTFYIIYNLANKVYNNIGSFIPESYKDLLGFFILTITILLPGIFILLLFLLAKNNLLKNITNFLLFLFVILSILFLDIGLAIFVIIFLAILYLLIRSIFSPISNLILTTIAGTFSFYYIDSVQNNQKQITVYVNTLSSYLPFLDKNLIFLITYFFMLSPLFFFILSIFDEKTISNKDIDNE